jgi:hypothetical protein
MPQRRYELERCVRYIAEVERRRERAQRPFFEAHFMDRCRVGQTGSSENSLARF